MYDVTRGLRKNGFFLLNTIFDGEELVMTKNDAGYAELAFNIDLQDIFDNKLEKLTGEKAVKIDEFKKHGE